MSVFPQRQFHSYLTSFALALFAAIIGVLAFVIVVDPYGLYKVMAPRGFNTIKPGLTRYQAEIKLTRAIQSKPQFVILGNSRAEIGFDPDSTAFSARAGSGFNLAVPGSGLDTALRQLDGLIAAGVKPTTVIVGVEFLDFLSAKTASTGDTPAAAPQGPAPGSRARSYWKFDALFSLESVKDAVRTLRIQHNDEANTLTQRGFNPFNEYRAYVRDDGYHTIFAQRSTENAASFRRKSNSTLSPDDARLLQTLLVHAAQIDADVKLVIYPYHAQILAMFEDANLWEPFERWKMLVADQAAQVKKDIPTAKIALFDFSGYGALNCEHIPLSSEKGKLDTRWYWEAGHFKKQLGDLVLQRIMAPSGSTFGDAGFGVEIDTANEESNRTRIRTERATCVQAEPATFAFSHQLFQR